MKRAMIPVMTALLVAALFTGCRKNVATVTDNTTAGTTQSTTSGTTQSSSWPTETARPSQATRPTTEPTFTQGDQTPSMLPETSDATGDSGRSRMMPPRH